MILTHHGINSLSRGYNIPYYSDFTNFNTTDLYDIPIIGRKEFVRNHQNLIYTKSNIVYYGNNFNALKVTQPIETNVGATDEMFNFGGRDYEIECIQFIEKVNSYPNFSIWPKLGSYWFGFGLHPSSPNFLILSQSSNYSLYNGASVFESGGYYWIDTGMIGNKSVKTKIRTNGNEVSFFVDGVLKCSIVIDDVFMNLLNFSPRYGKSFYIAELKMIWV